MIPRHTDGPPEVLTSLKEKRKRNAKAQCQARNRLAQEFKQLKNTFEKHPLLIKDVAFTRTRILQQLNSILPPLLELASQNAKTKKLIKSCQNSSRHNLHTKRTQTMIPPKKLKCSAPPLSSSAQILSLVSFSPPALPNEFPSANLASPLLDTFSKLYNPSPSPSPPPFLTQFSFLVSNPLKDELPILSRETPRLT